MKYVFRSAAGAGLGAGAAFTTRGATARGATVFGLFSAEEVRSTVRAFFGAATAFFATVFLAAFFAIFLAAFFPVFLGAFLATFPEAFLATRFAAFFTPRLLFAARFFAVAFLPERAGATFRAF